MKIKVSKDLKDEIAYRINDAKADGTDLDIATVIQWMIQDCDDPDSIAFRFRKELQDISIVLGIDVPVDITKVYVNRGKKYDFKRGKIYYAFESWDNLEGVEIE